MFKVNNIKNGVSAVISGFDTKELSDKIQACQEGSCSCDCDPAIMEKIESIELSNEEAGTYLTVKGDVDADTLAPMMQACLIGEKDEH